MTFKYTATYVAPVEANTLEFSPYKFEPFIPSSSIVTEEDFLTELTMKADYYNDYTYIYQNMVESVMRALRDLLIETAKAGEGTEMLFGLFQLMPVCNGFTVAPGCPYPPIDKLSDDDVAPQIALVISDSLQKDFLEGLELERVDDNAVLVTPAPEAQLTLEELDMREERYLESLAVLDNRDDREV